MRRRLASGVLLVTVALTACAGSEGGTGTADPVTPAAYLRQVCRAMVQWNEEVGSAFSATGARPDSDRPAAIRKDMLDFFDALQDATDTMRTRIQKAGAPDVAEGRAAAVDLQQALTGASEELKANRTRFAAIPLSDVEPAASIEGAMTVVGDQLEAILSSVLIVDRRSPELRRAREADADCIRVQELA